MFSRKIVTARVLAINTSNIKLESLSLPQHHVTVGPLRLLLADDTDAGDKIKIIK